MFKKESVLQTIVSGFFSGILLYILDKLFGHVIPWDELRQIVFLEFFLKSVFIYQLILFIALFLAIRFFWRKLKPPEVGSSLRNELKKFNQIENKNICWKWDVTFNPNGRPEIMNLRPYCKIHGDPPLKMNRDHSNDIYRCPNPNCTNVVDDNEYGKNETGRAKNYIESMLEKQWEEMNK